MCFLGARPLFAKSVFPLQTFSYLVCYWFVKILGSLSGSIFDDVLYLLHHCFEHCLVSHGFWDVCWFHFECLFMIFCSRSDLAKPSILFEFTMNLQGFTVQQHPHFIISIVSLFVRYQFLHWFYDEFRHGFRLHVSTPFGICFHVSPRLLFFVLWMFGFCF